MTNRPPFDEMLLIGAEGRNTGKTMLACAAISRFSRDHPVVGLKVTTVRGGHGPCPRGGEGCGACGSLDGPFCITEERDPAAGKDTARMLQAGAMRVYWARSRAENLGECIAAFRACLEPGTLVVAESNSLARAVEPGLFLMVRDPGSTSAKPSSRQVLPLADRVVVSDGRSFDLDLSELQVRGGSWWVRGASAAVLAGGSSSRMGVDKGLLEIDGVPLIAVTLDRLRTMFSDVLISANDPRPFRSFGAAVVPDESPGQGPLMGIAASVQAAAGDPVFVVACDIPDIDERLVRRLLRAVRQADCAVPRNPDGTWEPLFSAWRKSALPAIRSLLSTGRRKIDAVFPLLTLAAVEIEAGSIRNLNTPEDVAAYAAGARSRPPRGPAGSPGGGRDPGTI